MINETNYINENINTVGKAYHQQSQTCQPRTALRRLDLCMSEGGRSGRALLKWSQPCCCSKEEVLVNQWLCCQNDCHRNPNYRIALYQKTSVYRGTPGSRQSACGPNENLKERLRCRRQHLLSLVIFVMMLSTNSRWKFKLWWFNSNDI